MTAKCLHLVTCVVLRNAFCVISGFCIFVGNLNKSKTFDEVKDTLATYFMTKSLLVQDITLDKSKWVPCSTLAIKYKPGRLLSQKASKSRKSADLLISLIVHRKHNWLKGCVGYFRRHARVNLASQLDLTKALTLNGEQLLDKKLRIEKAKVKPEVKAKEKTEAKPEVKTEEKTKKKKSKALTEDQKGINTALSSQASTHQTLCHSFLTLWQLCF